MTSIPRRLACLALLLPALAAAELPPGISGAWYNPAQSGHGLSVEILDNERALAFWYVYDTEGNPVHLYLDGRIEGRRIEATAYAPRGMRFGSFRNADLRMPVWGEVALDFSSCDQGLLQWDSDLPGYGSGSSEIRRLTRIAGLDCDLDGEASGTSVLLTGVETHQPAAYAAIDEQGELWMLTPLATRADAVPGPQFVGAPSFVSRARIGSNGVREFQRFFNYWATGLTTQPLGLTAEGSLTREGGQLTLRDGTAQARELVLSPNGRSLLSPARVAGLWSLRLRNQFFDADGAIEVAADGSVCIRYAPNEPAAGCRFVGEITPVAGSAGFLRFELRSTGSASIPAFSGRGWLQSAEGEELLLLVGDNGATGFGLIGRR